jgi:hypothetical protein
LLLDQIASGELDAHLVAISEAVRARHELLHTINSQKALAMPTVGDRVRINRHARPSLPVWRPGRRRRAQPVRRSDLRPPPTRPVQERRDPLPTTRARAREPRCLTRPTGDDHEPASQNIPQLDHLIDEITVDCHDEDSR